MLKTIDFLNKKLHFSQNPQKIVSLVPSQTELLVDLGLEKNIVGITKFCVHPKHLKSTKTIVGGTKQVHFDKIKSLKPDIILCNKEENTIEMIEEFEQIAPIHISDIFTLEDNYKLINDYGEIFNVQSKAERLIRNLKYERGLFNKFILKNQPKKVAYLIWRKPWMAVGSNTFIDYMLTENKFQNVFRHHERYPEIDIQKLPEADLLLLSSEPYPFKPKHLEEIPIENSKIKFVNGEYFSWYGSRMIKAFRYFRELQLKN